MHRFGGLCKNPSYLIAVLIVMKRSTMSCYPKFFHVRRKSSKLQRGGLTCSLKPSSLTCLTQLVYNDEHYLNIRHIRLMVYQVSLLNEEVRKCPALKA